MVITYAANRHQAISRKLDPTLQDRERVIYGFDTTTAQLSWYVRNFLSITVLKIKQEQNMFYGYLLSRKIFLERFRGWNLSYLSIHLRKKII